MDAAQILERGNSLFSVFIDVEQTKENREGETCNTHGEDEISRRKNYFENIKGRNNLGFRCKQQDDNKTNLEYMVGEIVVVYLYSTSLVVFDNLCFMNEQHAAIGLLRGR